jgi:hypothetical protein
MSEELLQAPGQVNITEMILFSGGKRLSIIDYLVELNLYESIFNPVVSGTLTLSDSTNLLSLFPLIGEEFIFLNIVTPSLDDGARIFKTFKVYSIANKAYAKDGSTLIYQLNIVSTEAFNDTLNPLFKAFKGTPEEIVNNIFMNYLQAVRNAPLSSYNNNDEASKTSLTFLDSPSNVLKFVSPGWSPIQCINWVASKSLPAKNKAANFLFWETTKGFYFGSTDKIFANLGKVNNGTYVYSESFINTLGPDEKAKAMYSIKSLSIEKTLDQLDNTRTGYLSSTLIDINLYNKTFKNIVYDHANKFGGYSHLNENEAVPLFDLSTPRNPSGYIEVNYSTPKLHNTIDTNFDQISKYMHGNRRSNMLELNNFKMELVVPGRTDLEAGTIIKIIFPKGTPGALSKDQKLEDTNDKLYTGYYLITNLSHKINPKTHYITMNVVKDSFPKIEYYGALK